MPDIYYFVTFLTFLYILFKYVSNGITLLITLSFYTGLFSFVGGVPENMYKISLVILSFYLMYKYQPLRKTNAEEVRVIFAFLFFSVSFFYSAVYNSNDFSLMLSQYSKYFVPFCILFVFIYFSRFPVPFVKIQKLLFALVNIQIVLSVFKLFTFGVQEWVVGSISYSGGGIATPLPILVFILLWVQKNGDLKRKDWIYILAVLFVSFMSIKRAIWFMMPIMAFLFLVYVPRKKISNKFFGLILLIPVLFYLGVRLNPTLNKENQIWGSFDLDFVVKYTKEYSFGKEEESTTEKKVGQGRGGVTNMLLAKIVDPSGLNPRDFFGYGLNEIVTRDYETFDQEKFNVHSKGSVTGFFKTYIINGVLGIATFLFYLVSVAFLIKERRIRRVMIGFLLWDYFYYSGIIFPTYSLAIFLFYIILYANLKEGKLQPAPKIIIRP